VSDTQRQDELNYEAMLDESMDMQRADLMVKIAEKDRQIAELQRAKQTAYKDGYETGYGICLNMLKGGGR
jgi:UV DNA damage repair endonuclease